MQGLVEARQVVEPVIIHVVLGRGLGSIVPFGKGYRGRWFWDIAFLDDDLAIPEPAKPRHSVLPDDVAVIIVKAIDEVGARG